MDCFAALAMTNVGAMKGVGAMTNLDVPTSNPLNDLLPEQALWAEQQEDQRDPISEPTLDAAAEQGTPIEFAELLSDSDDEPADDRAGHRGQASEDQHRQSLQRDDLQGERHLRTRAPEYA